MNSKKKSLTVYGWLSIAASISTITLKTYAYWLTDSVGLLSDALESIINLVAAIIMLFVLHIAAQPPDETHPYGHEKIEYFSSGAEGVMILLAAFSISMTAWERLLFPKPLQQLDLGIVISVIASVINFIVAKILIHAGKKYRSIPLESDGKHLMTDVWTTIGILLAIGIIMFANAIPESVNFAHQFDFKWEILDPIIAIFVALNIVLAGLQLIRRTIAGLMDVALPIEEQAQIIAVFEEFSAAQGITYHAFRTRCSGTQRFVSAHILVPGNWTVQRGHDLVEEIEQKLNAIFEHIDIDTHLEPIEDPVSWEHLHSRT